ncbi:MAG: NAD(P)H-dependent oxidoreductase, partial [Proteobacteria bacterium]|nr:NAD(P)H-dependent oxidoreductase [Pseudomonadota bacterium]
MTKTILRIDCSPKASAAHSSRLADELTEKLRLEQPDMPVVHRILAERPPAFVDSGFALAMMTHQSAEAAAEHQALQTSEVLIRELENAAVLVRSTAMHNFTVPAVL